MSPTVPAGDAFLALEALARWTAWREERRGSERALPTKVPYNPRVGGSSFGWASSTDPATWGTQTQAEERARQLDHGRKVGCGMVLGDLGDGTYLGGLDLDSSLDENRQPALWAVRIISVLQTYAEISPSERGLKAFFRIAAADVRWFLDLIGVEKDAWGCKRGIPGLNGAAHGPGIEIYTSARYFTVTGRIWSSDHPHIVALDRDRLAALAALIPSPAGGITAPAGDGSPGQLSTAARLSTGRDSSRSGKALSAALALMPDSYEEMCDGLREHPDSDIKAWVEDKGEAHNERELKRIWGRLVSGRAERRLAGLAELETRIGADAEQADILSDLIGPNPADLLPPASPADADPDLGPTPEAGVQLDDFFAYMEQANFYYAPTLAPWPASSVNARIPPIRVGTDTAGDPIYTKASTWLAQNRPVEQITWAPGLPLLITDRLISEGGWIPRDGVNVLNLYRPPRLAPGDAKQAGPWLDHVKRVYPLDAEHIIRWFGQRVQHPDVKINHALALTGDQGIGKDSLIEPVKRAVGPWNFAEPTPTQMMKSQFNSYARSVILRISEARDLGDVDRYAFYEHLKIYCASPPDVLRVNEKNLREYNSLNCCGILITTNHKIDGIYLPADDRRHFIARSELKKESFEPDYWNELWQYYEAGGYGHVLAYLRQLDLTGFDPKAPPPKTDAFWDIVNAGRAPEDSELADVLDLLGNAPVVAVAQIIRTAEGSHASAGGVASQDFINWLKDRKNRRNIPHRLDACGYTPVRNPDAEDGLWVIKRRRMALYGRADLPAPQRIAAARALTAKPGSW